jgi:bifunctional hydroxylase/dehydrase
MGERTVKQAETQVVIVGGGPTGLMLAAELRLAGVAVTVLETKTEPTRESRALGFSARTIEEFDQRGILARFGEILGQPVGNIPVGHFGGIELDYRIVAGGSYGARGIPQSMTEGVLAGLAVSRGAVLLRGHVVTGVDTDDDGVTVSADTPDGPLRVRASYVVGCDGARSTVRKLAGIDFPGNQATLEMWLADVAGLGLRPRFSGERVPGGMVMVLPLGPHMQRVVVHERAAGAPSNRETLTFPEVAAAWQRLTGEDISAGKPAWVSWFTDASRLAAKYRDGRILLAGDAAHIHLPIGGQGMSAGIQDAVNLGWKLAAVLHGHAPDSLLDTYESERRPVAARVIANTLAQRTLYLSGDEMEPLREVFAEVMSSRAAQRHLVGMVTGLDIRYDVGATGHPLIGMRLPDQPLIGPAPATTTRTFDHLRDGRAVLFDLADDAALRDAVAEWGDRVRVVTAKADDHNSGELIGLSAVLVRPDGYVCWLADGPAGEQTGPAGLRASLERWLGAANLRSLT